MTRAARLATVADFILTVVPVLASIPVASALTPAFRHASGMGAALALAALQFTTEGLVPLLIVAVRRERWSDYGFARRNLGKSLALGVILAVTNDVLLSLHARDWLWIPLRRHTAVRISFAAGFPLSLAGLAVTIAAWGFFEAFFGVFFARKLNQLLGRHGRGWLAPGALGFALFNGLIHAAVGQGWAGFLASFGSGYAIAVIPAITGNAWGSGLFQTLTNAVGRL